jgi:hypothetical protein
MQTKVGDFYKVGPSEADRQYQRGLDEEQRRYQRGLDEKSKEEGKLNEQYAAAAPGLAKTYGISAPEVIARFRAGIPINQWGDTPQEQKYKSAQIDSLLANAARDRAAADKKPTEQQLNAALALFNTEGLIGSSNMSQAFRHMRASGDKREPRELMFDIINGIELASKNGGMNPAGKGRGGTVRVPGNTPPGVAATPSDSTQVKDPYADLRRIYGNSNR